MLKKILFYLVYFLSPAVLVAVIYFSNPSYFVGSRFISMFFGATAFTLLNAQLILSARPKLIEKSFGLDKLYRFHGTMALIALLWAVNHQTMEKGMMPENLQTSIGEAALAIFIGCAICALVLMTNKMLKKFGLVNKVRSYFSQKKFGQYDVQVVVHNFNVLATILLFIHVMLSPSANDALVTILYIIYFVVPLGFYLYHKLIRPAFFTKKFLVEAVVPESAAVTTLKLRPVDGQILAYKPGQFAFISIDNSAISAEEHPFSFTSSPHNQQTIDMSIKKLGDWTNKLSSVKIGNVVKLDGPYGKLSPVDYNCDEGVVLIAGGIGITPMISIMKYFAKAQKKQKVILFWGVKTSEELIFKQEINSWLKQMPNFTFVPVVSRSEFKGERGHINQEIINKYLQQQTYDANKLQYFFCGPEPMWLSIKQILLDMGIKKNQIHQESFSL